MIATPDVDTKTMKSGQPLTEIRKVSLTSEQGSILFASKTLQLGGLTITRMRKTSIKDIAQRAIPQNPCSSSTIQRPRQASVTDRHMVLATSRIGLTLEPSDQRLDSTT